MTEKRPPLLQPSPQKQLNEQTVNELREIWALVSEQPGISVRAIARKMNITHARSRKLTKILIDKGKLTRGKHSEMGTLKAPIPLLTGPYVRDKT